MLEAKLVVEFNYSMGIPDGLCRFKELVDYRQCESKENISMIAEQALKSYNDNPSKNSKFELIEIQEITVYPESFTMIVKAKTGHFTVQEDLYIEGSMYPVLVIGDEYYKLGEKVHI